MSLSKKAATRAALTAVATVCVVSVSGCAAPPPSSGPAEVSVAKRAATPAPPPGNQSTLTRLVVADVPAAADVQWGDAPQELWLPQASEVTAGLAKSTPVKGAFYLSVPATYPVTSQAVVAGERRTTLQDVSVTAVPKPTGTVITGHERGTDYTISVSPDPTGRDGYSIVMVEWQPYQPTTDVPQPASTSASSPAATPGR